MVTQLFEDIKLLYKYQILLFTFLLFEYAAVSFKSISAAICWYIINYVDYKTMGHNLNFLWLDLTFLFHMTLKFAPKCLLSLCLDSHKDILFLPTDFMLGHNLNWLYRPTTARSDVAVDTTFKFIKIVEKSEQPWRKANQWYRSVQPNSILYCFYFMNQLYI